VTETLTVLVLTGLPPDPVTVTVNVLVPEVVALTDTVLAVVAPVIVAPVGAVQA